MPAPRHEVLEVGDPKIGDRLGLDIGPATIKQYESLLADAKTVIWNGPMGVFEIDAFANGTNAVARAVANVKGTTIIGGGDSIAALRKAGMADRVTHISTGGGASLEFLGGRTLPGVAALTDGVRAGSRQTCRTAISIAGNWKMFKTVQEAVVFVKELRSLVKDITDVEIVVAPPFTALHAVAEAARNTNIGVVGAGRLLGARGRVHRRDFPRHDQGSRRRVRRSSATRSAGGCSARATRS